MGIQKEAHFTMLILYWSASAFEHMFFREVDMHLGGVFWLKSLHLSVCFTFCKRITKSIWNPVEIFMPPTWKFQMKFEYNKHPANVYPLHSTFLPWKEKIYFFTCPNFFSPFLSENSGILLATKSWSKMDSHLTELFSCERAAL